LDEIIGCLRAPVHQTFMFDPYDDADSEEHGGKKKEMKAGHEKHDDEADEDEGKAKHAKKQEKSDKEHEDKDEN